jgi:hypothetical protein
MSDDEFVFAPRVTTDGIERILRDEEHCTKSAVKTVHGVFFRPFER